VVFKLWSPIVAGKPRVHFAGALYHVMSRGNQGQSIFKDDEDRERYLVLLKKAKNDLATGCMPMC